MALFAIPNPKKSTQVDFPTERVKLSVENIHLINNKYKFTSANAIFNQYTFEALEFLSLGVFIDINLNSVSENKTEITVEVRRKLGSFNQSHEVTKANEHLVKIFDAIAKLTTMSLEEIDELKKPKQNIKTITNKQETDKNKGIDSNSWYEKNWLVILLCIIFFPVGLYALWKNSSISNGWKIAVTCFFGIVILVNIGDKKEVATNTETTTSATQKEAEAPKVEETTPEVEETKPDIEILKQSSTYEDVMDAYTIHCRVRNNTDELINYVDLKATFYDKQGNIVGTGMGNAVNFAAGAEKTIDVMGMDIQNCDTYEVQVDNVMK